MNFECDQCGKETPVSAATFSDKSTILMFCGEDCKAKWERGQPCRENQN